MPLIPPHPHPPYSYFAMTLIASSIADHWQTHKPSCLPPYPLKIPVESPSVRPVDRTGIGAIFCVNNNSFAFPCFLFFIEPCRIHLWKSPVKRGASVVSKLSIIGGGGEADR